MDQPSALSDLWSAAGFANVETGPLVIPMEFFFLKICGAFSQMRRDRLNFISAVCLRIADSY